MDIENFKVKPKLIELIIDQDNIKDAYGDSIKFWMFDHLTLPVYFDFFKAQSEGDVNKLLNIIKDVILDKDGNKILDKDHELPVDIFAAAVVKITEHLGKSATKNSSQKETGTQQ